MNSLKFEDVYTQANRNRVLNICYKMLKNKEDSEDISQDVWLKVCRKLHTYNGTAQFTTWLHVVTVNQVLQTIRSRKMMHGKLHSLEDMSTCREGYYYKAYQDAITIEDSDLRSVSAREDLARAFEFVPAGFKQALVLHYLEGLNHEEIADLLGTSVGCSKSQLHKARLCLGRLLGAPEPDVDIDETFNELEKYL